jgi:glutamyl-tRNA reductase
MKNIFVTGISYKTAPLAIRELFAVPPARQTEIARELLQHGLLTEVVVLWTCNRVEIYGVSSATRPDPEALMRVLVQDPAIERASPYCHHGPAAARHLFSVTAGMESMVIGETEILGQVKSAYERARAAGLTGRALNRMFQKSFEAAKAVRTRTSIGKGTASVGSVAVQHARRIFGSSLEGRRVMVIGAGSMAEKCLRHLVKKGAASIAIVNRSHDKAEALAATYGGTGVPFGRCLDAMMEVEIVITSTGCPHVILERSDIETVMAARPDRPLVVVDIAVPRDVAPDAGLVPNVHLHNIEDLEGTVRETIRYRQQELDACQNFIEEKVGEWMERMRATEETLCEAAV